MTFDPAKCPGTGEWEMVKKEHLDGLFEVVRERFHLARANGNKKDMAWIQRVLAPFEEVK